MDRWILSRLAHATEQCNRGFETYDFAGATNACYNFWLYDLCDVYLECVKPCFYGTDAAAKLAARRTLFTCLHNGLKLISPFMPFVSEELFQRLPRTAVESAAVPSICVAAYPQASGASPWRDEALERDVEFVQRAARVIRSARSDYNIPNKTKTDAYVVCTDAATAQLVRRFAVDLATQAYCVIVAVLDDSGANGDAAKAERPPTGSAILTVSAQCEVHLVLRGLIDADKELAKLQKKRDQLVQTVAKLNASMAAADYGVKVPAEVQQANAEKLEQSRGEMERIAGAMETLALM